MKFVKAMIAATVISTVGMSAHAGGLNQPEEEKPVEVPFDPPRGSVNGGYILLGAFLLGTLASIGG